MGNLMKFLTRLVLLVLVVSTLNTAFGWPFGAEEEEAPKKKRKREKKGRRRNRDKADDAGPSVDGDDRRKDARDAAYEQRYQERARNRVQRSNTQMDDFDDIGSKEMDNIVHDQNLEESVSPLDNLRSTEELTEEWEKNMHDFVPSDFVTFEINEGSSVMLLEKIAHEEPTRVRGAYYVVGGSKQTRVSSVVLDENMDVLYNHHNDMQGIILFDTSISGESEYAFLFTNESPGTRIVTFGLHTEEKRKSYVLPKWDIDEQGNIVDRVDPGDDAIFDELEGPGNSTDKGEDGAADDEDIGNVRTVLRKLNTELNQMKTEVKRSFETQTSANMSVAANQRFNFYAVLIELSCFLGILGFQLYHTKKSLDNKLIL